MPRFYFELEGAEHVSDNCGCQYRDSSEAFVAAQRLARDIAEARPHLRGRVSVVMTERGRPDDLYCIGICFGEIKLDKR